MNSLFEFGAPATLAVAGIYHYTTSATFCQDFFEKYFFIYFFLKPIDTGSDLWYNEELGVPHFTTVKYERIVLIKKHNKF